MSLDPPKTKTKAETYAELIRVIAFLGQLEQDQPELTVNGITVTEVVDAFCRVSGVERYKVGQVLKALKKET